MTKRQIQHKLKHYYDLEYDARNLSNECPVVKEKFGLAQGGIPGGGATPWAVRKPFDSGNSSVESAQMTKFHKPCGNWSLPV
ncbi:hypothetical protein Sfum_3081 [Syntrophobacter fumaroxidans MPOB]|uniref:Uncharacterized protein n=1 Tax=Syntrophobacter fumaroxidans (strain DSM 10017 / MPOB) TaxID=335543 RepID=A0LMV2_SYNFM|nr:hypothetical protein Sfum_3081 [Syntrophobacter fumaroxidans MPOB]